SALGVNIQAANALAFFIGSALAGLGGALAGVFLVIAPGEDADFLLKALVVVIVGGMGSLGGAALGALALGMIETWAPQYLPGARVRRERLVAARVVGAAGPGGPLVRLLAPAVLPAARLRPLRGSRRVVRARLASVALVFRGPARPCRRFGHATVTSRARTTR